MQLSLFPEQPGTRVIYRPYITIKGRRIYAWQRGLKAFPIRIKV